MNHSFYWDKMLINRTGITNDGLIISQEPPDFFTNNKLWENVEIKCLYEKTINFKTTINKLSDFYKKNNKLKTGNITLVEPEDILKYINLNGELVMLCEKRKRKRIMGSVISLHIPVRINTEIETQDIIEKSNKYKHILPNNPDGKNFIFGCTTFLNNHRNYRKRGLGMVMIQKSLEIAYKEGILSAYFLNTVKRCTNAIPVRNWYFPLNLSKCDQYGIGYYNSYRGYYKVKVPVDCGIIKIDKSNLSESLNEYLDLIKNKKFYMIPDINYWSKWTKLFSTYMVKKNNKIIGIFTLNGFNNLITEKNCILKYGQIMIYISRSDNNLDVMKSLLSKAVETYDIMHLQQAGNVTPYILQKILAIDTKQCDYINFYNSTINLTSDEVYVPLV